MRTGYDLAGADALIRRLQAHPEAIARKADSILKQEARALAVAYGAATEPAGMDDSSANKFRKTVEGDVRAVYASRQDAGRVFALLQSRNPELAKAYWHAYKSKQPRRMGQILTQAGLPQGIDPAALKRARTGAGGRVRRKGLVPASLASEAQVRAFARKQVQLVGFAKAGWYAAARALGGRARRNDRDAATGKRSTAEIFPPYVRKIQRRFPNIGGAQWFPGRVEIFTRVRHAGTAMPAGKQDAAYVKATISLANALAKGVAEVNRKFYDAKVA